MQKSKFSEPDNLEPKSVEAGRTVKGALTRTEGSDLKDVIAKKL